MAWVCPLCSTANEDSMTECMVCGQERVYMEEPSVEAPSGWGAALARAARTAPVSATTGGARSWGAALAGATERREESAPRSWSAALAGASESDVPEAPEGESIAARLARAISSSEEH